MNVIDSLRITIAILAGMVGQGQNAVTVDTLSRSIVVWEDVRDSAFCSPDTLRAPSYWLAPATPPTPCEFGEVIRAETLGVCIVIPTLPSCDHICVNEWDANGCKRFREICPLGITGRTEVLGCIP
jgi:hypothetical protein